MTTDTPAPAPAAPVVTPAAPPLAAAPLAAAPAAPVVAPAAPVVQLVAETPAPAPELAAPSVAEFAALQVRVAAAESAALGHVRASVLASLGVMPGYQEFAPPADPRTPEGRSALEAWATAHPALLSKGAPAAPVAPVVAPAFYGANGAGNLFTSPASYQLNKRDLGI